jgi:hypothetical protein
MSQQFRKLNINLPRQPLSDQRIWMVAGWLLAAIIIVIVAISYIDYLKTQENGQTRNHFGTNISKYHFIKSPCV